MGLREMRSAPVAETDSGAGAARRFERNVERYRRLLLDEINLAEMSTLDPTQRRARLERVLSRILRRDGPLLSAVESTQLIRRVIDDALGLGVLEPLLADQGVTEIMVNGPDDVWVERGGRLERVPVAFASEEQLYQTIDRIVSQVNRRVDESSPMVDARLPTGERVNVVIPPLALSGPTLTIRRFPRPIRMDELVGMNAVDADGALLLAAAVRSKLNVMISGGTGTGKTTMLNALSGFIPGSERIITIEDAAELRLQQEHVISLESRPPNVEGKGQVSIRDLVRNSLRMRPDRIIVGEVRGGETLDMLQAMNTGHEGSLATVHANTAEDAVARLETLASMSDLALPFAVVRDQINNAIDLIVHLARYHDGSRRISEVAAVTSRRHEEFRLQTVLRFVPDPLTPDHSTVTGRFEHSPLPAGTERRLFLAGEAVPGAFQRGLAADEPPAWGA
ncbi:MAG TPA: CpaF family protein [Actinomycetales bacterium]|nr:CpaF family protein [Actinomycetales bacterium]